MTTKTAYAVTLCGPTCTGKTTLLGRHKFLSKLNIASSDNYIIRLVKNGNIPSFSSAFKGHNQKFFKEASSKFKAALCWAHHERVNVVCDRTNVSPIARKQIVKHLLPDHKHVAIAFSVNEGERRMRSKLRDSRYRRTGRENMMRQIPFKVQAQQVRDYSIPTLDEGFDTVIVVDSNFDVVSVEGERSFFVENVLQGITSYDDIVVQNVKREEPKQEEKVPLKNKLHTGLFSLLAA